VKVDSSVGRGGELDRLGSSADVGGIGDGVASSPAPILPSASQTVSEKGQSSSCGRGSPSGARGGRG